MVNAARLQEQQQEFEYRTALRQQDTIIDLQMNERAKLWEIEKMEIRSRGDFAREERIRVRKLDEQQAKLTALEKARDDGTVDEDEYKKLVLRLTTGIPLSVTERAKVGIPPYWMAGREAPEGTPERALYESKMAEALKKPEDIKRTDIDAAIKFLQEYEEKKERAAKIYHPLAPEPTLEEESAAEFYRGILEGVTPSPDISIEGIAEPVTNTEFENNVRQLAAIDKDKALIYYKKWVGKF